MSSAERKPTDGELAILRVLWARGPSTVREVRDELIASQPKVGYTTVLKLMQIMTVKKLVQRDESNRTHRYRASFSEDQTQRHLLKDLVARVFGGSTQKLVLQALATTQSSPQELAEIRKLLRAAKETRKNEEG